MLPCWCSRCCGIQIPKHNLIACHPRHSMSTGSRSIHQPVVPDFYSISMFHALLDVPSSRNQDALFLPCKSSVQVCELYRRAVSIHSHRTFKSCYRSRVKTKPLQVEKTPLVKKHVKNHCFMGLLCKPSQQRTVKDNADHPQLAIR